MTIVLAVEALLGLLVGLTAHALPTGIGAPLWLTSTTGVAAALLGTAASRLFGTTSPAPTPVLAALLAPLLFACIGVAVLASATRRSPPPR